MSDNKLLAENTIRRFMKLANVDSLTETFIDNLEERGMMRGRDSEAAPMKHDDDHDSKKDKKHKKDKEEKVRKEEAEQELEENEENLDEDIEDLFEEEDEDDMDDMDDMDDLDDMGDMGDMEPDAELGAADMSLTEEEAQVLIDLGKRLEEAMAVDDEPEPDMGAEPDMDDEAMDDDPMGEPEAAGPGEDEDDLMQEELVQEVLKRVTKRLVAAKLNRK